MWKGVSGPAKEILAQSWRKSTRSKYEVYLRKWRAYCVLNNENWLCPGDISVCVNFLAKIHLDGLNYSGVNVARSALSAVVEIPGIGQVGEHPLIKRLLRGVYLRTPPVPRYVTTWDVNVMFDFLRLKPNAMNLNLKDLSLFTVTL